MIQLHFCPNTAAMVPHILLEELGVPYQRVDVDRDNNAHKSAAYLKLNPNGLIPVLVDGDLVLYETAAICLHLCDTHPQANLMPALGTAERAHAYKWLVWLTNALQTTLLAYFYPERWVGEGNTAGALEVKARADARVALLIDQLDAELARHGGPWFMGQIYSVLDPYVYTLCRWTRDFDSPPARTWPHLAPYLQRVEERAAVQRMLANEGLTEPRV